MKKAQLMRAYPLRKRNNEDHGAMHFSWALGSTCIYHSKAVVT